MAKPTGQSQYTTPQVSLGSKTLGGGLNSTAGNLQLEDNESSKLQNIDFDKFGSILKRNGYTALNTSAIASSPASDGLFWHEWNASGTQTRKLMNVAGGKFWKMDDLDGTWDDITGALTITSGNHCDFESFLNECYVTNGYDVPFKWTGTGNGSAMTVPSSLTKAKYVKQFNNYLFLANVYVGTTYYPSRFYWSNLKDTGTWLSTSWIEIAKDDGQEITGIKVLSDRLVVFKGRSIYNVFFTGDADIPFTVSKSNSPVGCVAPFSIQEVDNGLVFLAPDGIYYYDGNNSYKISVRIQTTLDSFNQTKMNTVVSSVYRKKNLVYFAFCSSSATTHDRVIVWNYFLNSFSVYSGMAIAGMAQVFPDGMEERPYFADYSGFAYRMDTGENDYPLNVKTAIDSYYYTNWKTYDDLVSKKGIVQCNIFYTISNSVVTFVYAYDFEDADQFSLSLNLSTSTSTYGSAIYGTARYAGAGGAVQRKDVTGRGRAVRFGFKNNTIDESFKIDGFGTWLQLETNV